MKLAMVSLVFATLLASCSEDDGATDPVQDEQSAQLTAEDSQLSAEADEASDMALDMIDIAYAEREEWAAQQESFFSDCVTVIVSSENDVTFVTLDFGLGCELRNGAIISGKINFSYGPLVAETRSITYQFEDFVYNDKTVAGGGSIFRERGNLNGNPQSTANKDLEVTLSDGIIAQVRGTRVLEWIEGVGSGVWRDNVYLITGNRNVEVSTGFTHQAEVIVPLRKEASCPFIVSGEVSLLRNQKEGTLNFGDGTCDRRATLSVNGEDFVIILR
ncbi:hypothetical protein BST85_01410 [Aureitalea marina]|uniref:Lipoprotein n=2 Tax=Aureitalea marina TaxID=930804 RepID=A0A2S7KM50_9FLAO|nr:hypothetical protein BST85_01410 [Aureitalea marina]